MEAFEWLLSHEEQMLLATQATLTHDVRRHQQRTKSAMDHLKTSQERRDRWYSKIWPRYIPVVESKNCNEALEPQKVYDCAKSIRQFDLLESDNLKSVLNEHGFVVISGVLSESDCQGAVALGWDYLEAASVAEHGGSAPPLRRHDATTHDVSSMPKSVEGGMLPYYGSGHSTLAWFVRSHPRVCQVFRSLFGTDDLVSSLDGLVLWLSGVGATDCSPGCCIRRANDSHCNISLDLHRCRLVSYGPASDSQAGSVRHSGTRQSTANDGSNRRQCPSSSFT